MPATSPPSATPPTAPATRRDDEHRSTANPPGPILPLKRDRFEWHTFCHPRESGDPVNTGVAAEYWIPAFRGDDNGMIPPEPIPLLIHRDDDCPRPDQADADPGLPGQVLAEDGRGENCDEHHAELVDGRDLGGVAELQSAEIAQP